ncbi:SDR family oxidoreductase [Frigidibacter sp. MR17.24]|uniref:SDR family oxidoreductase n=1 Tax=Frigidibacter sp. MR17.24 TaxID=3127345 RepID=UPI003012F974
MDLGVKDRVALVFGAGGGLGGAVAEALAGEGARVIAADLDLDAAEATVGRITAAGGSARAMAWNLSDRTVIEARLQDIEATEGPVSILVNNTGGPPPTPVSGQSPADWLRYFEMMALSVIAITDRVLPGMKAAGWGRIVTSTSSGIVAPIPNLGLSNALRMTLLGWSKTLAREVGRDGITANVILPGRVATGRILFLDEQKAKREERSTAEVTAESTGSIPLGRYGRPEEYGRVATFLASDAASYVTGSVIRVDGGLIPSV